MPSSRSQQRRAEALRLLIDAVEDYAIFMLSPEGDVESWNPGAQRIKGYRADEIIGQHFSVFYTPEEREAGRPMTLLGWAAQHGRFQDEGWRVRKDGTRFWADVVVTAIHDGSGELIGFAKVTRDLTERRAAEEQRRILEGEQRARAAAEEALVVRDRFLSIASHELKTPVAGIQLAVDSMLRMRQRGRLDDDRLTANLRRLAVASGRLAALVDELLDVSRLAAEPRELTTAPTDLAALAREVVERFEVVAEGRLGLEAPGELWLDADASRLDQVISNLVDNAVKYSQAPAPVQLTVREAGDEVEIEVSDRGIGVDTSASAHLFEAFGRGGNAEHIRGLGLGLYIVHQIVHRHRGRVEARRREDGQGSVFRVVLPRRSGE